VKNDEPERVRRLTSAPAPTDRVVLRPPAPAPERGIALLPALSQAGLDELLDRPVATVVPAHWPDVRGRPVTIREALQFDGGPGLVSPARRAALTSVGESLARSLGRERALESRERWWGSAVPPAVAHVARALRRRVDALPREALRSLPERGELEVLLDDAKPGLELVDASGREPRVLATLSLALDAERETPEFSALDVMGVDLSPSTVPSALRAEGVLTAIALEMLHDRGHPLHARAVAALRAPAWERLLVTLDGVAAEHVEGREGARVRLAFRLRTKGPRVEGFLTFAQRSKGADKWTGGSHLTRVRDLEKHVLRDPADRAFVEALSGGDALIDAESLTYPTSPRRVAALLGHPRVVDDATETTLFVRRAALELVATDVPGGVEVGLRLGGATFEARTLETCLVGNASLVVHAAARHELLVAPLTPPAVALLRALAQLGTAIVPAASVARLDASLGALSRVVSISLPESLRGERRASRARLTLRLGLEGELLEARLLADPLGDGTSVVPGEGEAVARALFGEERVYAERDLEAERALAERLAGQLELRELDRVATCVWRIAEPDVQIDLVRRAPELADALDVEWLRGERRAFAGRASAASLSITVATSADWLDLAGGVDVDGRIVALAELLAAVRERRRYVRVAGDQFVLIEDELRARLERLSELTTAGGGRTLAPKLLAEPLVEAAGGAPFVLGDLAFGALRDRYRDAREAPAAPVPASFVGALRSYQREGFEWLARLSAWAPGACLADDMGLGKTPQALALLLHRASEGPALVIAPTSVCDNWIDEASRFAPSLRVVAYRGPEREALRVGLGAGDVLVASYDVTTLDREALEAHPFATLVIDEAQAIKNPGTQRAMAVRALGAGFRLALTGTPIENRLGELWSLFDVLAPGMLGSAEQFRGRFATPIERHGDEGRRASLARLVAPFLLRRRKDQVAPELPPRTELVRPVELVESERKLYEAERLNALAALGKAGAFEGRGRFAVLAAITRLRLLACDPALVLKQETGTSSKTAALLDVLDDVRASGGRALVFSEFTSYLDRVGLALAEHAIESLRLDGATPAKERARLVAAWQSGTQPVFLISRKAGGTGLNLTAADWVVHLDPWWNPAVEDQATDRAHRIGQERPVTAIRLVSQGTIEQRVLAMHARKRALASGVLEGTHAGAALDVDELIALLRDSG
jgi:superfamily II DNA or RNA helicase